MRRTSPLVMLAGIAAAVTVAWAAGHFASAGSGGPAAAGPRIDSTKVEPGRATFEGKADISHWQVVKVERAGKPLEWKSAGRGPSFTVVVRASDAIPLGEGKTGRGFVVEGFTGAGAGAPAGRPGSVANVHLAGDLAGALVVRAERDVVTTAGAVEFADIVLAGGRKLPVTFRLERVVE